MGKEMHKAVKEAQPCVYSLLVSTLVQQYPAPGQHSLPYLFIKLLSNYFLGEGLGHGGGGGACMGILVEQLQSDHRLEGSCVLNTRD